MTSYGEVIRKSTVNKNKVMQISDSAFSIEKSFWRFSHLFLSDMEKKTPLQMEIYFIYVNFSYKSIISSLFLEILLCLTFLKIISSKQFLCQRGIFWDGVYSATQQNDRTEETI